MRGQYSAWSVYISILHVCVNLGVVTGADGSAHTTEPPPARRSINKHHMHTHPHTLTRPVTLQDCRQEQLPAHLLGGGATDTEPTDYVLTAATDYKPYVMRAFLNSFRRHNDAARIVVLVSPNQV